VSSRGGGYGGQPNMQQLMKRAQKMQQELELAGEKMGPLTGGAGGLGGLGLPGF